MIARAAELVLRPNASNEFQRLFEVLTPKLQARPGFVDHFLLELEHEARVVLVISLWETSADAEAYQAELYPEILESVSALIESRPIIRSFVLKGLHRSRNVA